MELVQEILQNEEARLDLYKWKVILVAGLGAAASGLVGGATVTPVLPLALVPLVCIYVDLLCLDMTLRIVAITRYLNLDEDRASNTRYAVFVAEEADQMKKAPSLFGVARVTARAALSYVLMRRNAPSSYALGFLAQGLSTSVLSVAIILWARIFMSARRDQISLSVAGVMGVVSTLWTYLEYKRRTEAIAALNLPARLRCGS